MRLLVFMRQSGTVSFTTHTQELKMLMVIQLLLAQYMRNLISRSEFTS